MVKLATSVLAVSLLALPALAAPAEFYERSVTEGDLYGRDQADAVIVTREDLYDIFGREFVDDIEERSPFGLGGLLKVGEKLGGKFFRHSHISSSNNNNNNNPNNNRREFDEEELEAREPNKYTEVFDIAKKFVGHHHRGPHIPSVDLNSNNGDGGNPSRREFDEEEFDLRDFDEDLEAREPINPQELEKLAKLAHHARKFGKHAKQAGEFANNANNVYNTFQGNSRRDLDEEVFEREFDDEEFSVREYYDDLD